MCEVLDLVCVRYKMRGGAVGPARRGDGGPAGRRRRRPGSAAAGGGWRGGAGRCLLLNKQEHSVPASHRQTRTRPAQRHIVDASRREGEASTQQSEAPRARAASQARAHARHIHIIEMPLTTDARPDRSRSGSAAGACDACDDDDDDDRDLILLELPHLSASRRRPSLLRLL